MRLLVISQYFWPENFRVNDLVTGLVARGYQVTVLTGQPNYPTGCFVDGYGWSGPSREEYAGAEVVRVPLLPRGAGGSLRLMLNYMSFVITACWGVLFRLQERSFDAIVVFEPSPITVGIPAALARWRFRVPVLFWVLDLWPESLAAVGAVRSPMVLRWVDSLVRAIYRRCDLVLVQSRAFIPAVMRHGVAEDAVRYFPNWGEAIFESPASIADLPQLQAICPGFRVLFAGNVGAAQDFGAVLDAASLLEARTDVQWIIVGDGRMANWAKHEVLRRGLQRTVHFTGQHPLEAMPKFFEEADALLLSLRRDPIFALTVPGKLQSYLASGKPVLAMLDGEGARIVTEADAGLCCAAGDAAGLARAVTHLAELPEAERQRMGQNGKAYYSEHFARARVFDHLESWLVEVTQPKERGIA